MPFDEFDEQYWATSIDPEWVDRVSLHELQLKDAIDLGCQTAEKKVRQTDSLPQIVTHAIATMVPVEVVKNGELARILLGDLEVGNARLIRHFRNGKRPINLNKAGSYIQRLLVSKVILPNDGVRLWYATHIYATGIAVVTDYFREVGPIANHVSEIQDELTIAAVARFPQILEDSAAKSAGFPLAGFPLNDARQFMDYGVFIHWQESKVKRNPLSSIKRILELATVFDGYEFGV